MGRIAGILIAVLAVVIGVVGVALHHFAYSHSLLISAAAFAPYLMIASVIGLIVALVVQAWWMAGIGMLVVAAAIATQIPLYLSNVGGSGPAQLSVLQANLELGQGDVSALADAIESNDIGVATITELTDEALTRIESSSIPARLPHSVTVPARAGNGGSVYSRFPIVEHRRLEGFWLLNFRVVIDVPARGQIAVYGLHLMPPYPDHGEQWAAELRALRAELSAEKLPVIVAGDFNATYDHRQYRALLDDSEGGPGMLDAAVHTGAGPVRTYPTDRWTGPLIAIDRALSRGGPEPIEFRRLDLPDSDHDAVIARFRGLPDRR